MMIEERSAVRESHDHLAFYNTAQDEIVTFLQSSNVRNCCAVMDVLFEVSEVIIVFKHASKDIIELPHVALEVGRQRDRRAALRDAPAFADRGIAILEIVDAKI